MSKESNKGWPVLPTDENGKPRPWVVATMAFNDAACISLYRIFPGWYFSVPVKFQDDAPPCRLVAAYDPCYRTFQVDRLYATGLSERIFSPSGAVPPPDYRQILDLMQVWQDEARRRQCTELDENAFSPPNAPRIDLIL